MMKIGFDMSYTIPLNLYREGITVFNRFLFDSLLTVRSDLTIEIWCYENNRDEILKAYESIFKKYGKRVSLLTELKYVERKSLDIISIPKVLNRTAQLLFAALTFKNHNFLHKCKENLKRELYVVREELKPCIYESGANIAFFSISPHVLSSEIIFNGPMLFFIHDLHDIVLRELFRKTVAGIDESIAGAVADLNRYAQRGAFFTCYSNYIRDGQILEWVPGIKKEQVSALKIPPIFKKFKKTGIPGEEEFRAKFNITGPYTPFASLIRPNKNVMLLLRAIKILKDSSIDLKFVTTGSFAGCPDETAFIAKNDLTENIVETGILSEAELFALYKYSSLMVVTTRAEGPGIAQQCLEALNAGNIPVVHTKAAGINEALAQRDLSLKTADLNWVDCDDHEDLACKIREVLADPRKHVEKQKNIISHFTSPSWNETAQKFISIMEDMIARYNK